MKGRLTKAQAAQVKSLMVDGGWSAKEARALVLAGLGEPQTPPDWIADMARRMSR